MARQIVQLAMPSHDGHNREDKNEPAQRRADPGSQGGIRREAGNNQEGRPEAGHSPVRPVKSAATAIAALSDVPPRTRCRPSAGLPATERPAGSRQCDELKQLGPIDRLNPACLVGSGMKVPGDREQIQNLSGGKSIAGRSFSHGIADQTREDDRQ